MVGIHIVAKPIRTHKMKEWLKAFTHNAIVHPLMMFVPREIGDKMHDANADWAFGKESRYDELTLEKELGK